MILAPSQLLEFIGSMWAPDTGSALGASKTDNCLNLSGNGGGGGNRTRVRMASSQRVYVRSHRSISEAPVATTGEVIPRRTLISSTGCGLSALGDQPSDGARDPLEDVADERR